MSIGVGRKIKKINIFSFGYKVLWEGVESEQRNEILAYGLGFILVPFGMLWLNLAACSPLVAFGNWLDFD